MKKINIFLCILVLLTGLASCEMKDEIAGKDKIVSGETGLLELGVEKGKAGGSMSTKATDNVDEFPVTITGKDVEYTKTFDSYEKLQAENPIKLPIGSYTVAAHSPVEFAVQMTSPYYGGESEVLIKKNETQNTTITCKMQNMKIALAFSSAMDQTYESWDLTVTDNKEGHVQHYTKEAGLTPAPFYWKMDDNTSDIFIQGYAVNKNGEQINIDETATKSQTDGYLEEDGVYYKGGDFLYIKLDPIKDPSSETTPGVEKESIKITITGFNEETEEEIKVDVEGGDKEPTNPTDPIDPTADLSITLPADITYTEGNAPTTNTDAVIKASKGLKKVVVRIVAGNASFAEVLAKLQLSEGEKSVTFIGGVDLVSSASSLEAMFTQLGKTVPAPKDGDTEYTFPIGEFFSFLDLTGQTDAGKAHQFIISVEDKDGNKKENTLNVTIKAAE